MKEELHPRLTVRLFKDGKEVDCLQRLHELRTHLHLSVESHKHRLPRRHARLVAFARNHPHERVQHVDGRAAQRHLAERVAMVG